jgi:O-antigen/teichoic acid export membrane protein
MGLQAGLDGAVGPGTPEPPRLPGAGTAARVNLTRASLLNLLGEGLPLLVSFFAVRVLIRSLGDQRYGVLVVAWTVMAYLSLVDLGMGRALTQSVARKIAAREFPGDLVCTGLVMIFALGVAGAAALAALAPSVVGWLRVPAELAGETRWALYALALSLPLPVVTAGLRGILEGLNRFGLLAGVKCVMGTAVLLVPLAVLPFTVNLAAVVAAAVAVRLVGTLVHATACLWALRGAARGARVSASSARELLHFGRWLTVDNVVSPALVFADRWVLSRSAGASAVGYYGTPVDLVLRLLFVPAAVAAVLFPAFAAGLAGRGPAPAAALDRGSRLLAAILFPVTLLLVGLAPEAIRLWLGADWAAHAARVLQLAAVALFVGGMTMGPVAMLQAAGRPDLPAIFHLVELPLHLAILAALTARWGAAGAAAALLVRVTIDHLALAWAVPRALRGDAALRKVMRRVLIGTLAGAACLMGLSLVGPAAGRVLLLAAALPLFALLAYARLLHREELAWLYRLLRRPAVPAP